MQKSDKETDIAPEMALITYTSLLTPPLLKEDMDHLQWREDTRETYNNVLAFVEGGDTRGKGVATCLGLTVYPLLESSFKEQLMESVQCGEILLRISGGTTKENQVRTLEKKYR